MTDAVSNERADALERTRPVAARAPNGRPSAGGRHDTSDAVLSRKTAANEREEKMARRVADSIVGRRGVKDAATQEHRST